VRRSPTWRRPSSPTSWPAAYGARRLRFGPDYLIPKPFDPRLIVQIAPAVAQAAMDSGVATRPIEDFDAYRDRLSSSSTTPACDEAGVRRRKRAQARHLRRGRGRARAARGAGGGRRGLARPILIGRPDVIEPRIERYGLRLRRASTSRWSIRTTTRATGLLAEYYRLASPSARACRPSGQAGCARRTTLIGAMLVRRGDADAMLCGTIGTLRRPPAYIAT
jgi:malate dehydrogenase (oxaloacetate-decarboxylating)(NADP+)